MSEEERLPQREVAGEERREPPHAEQGGVERVAVVVEGIPRAREERDVEDRREVPEREEPEAAPHQPAVNLTTQESNRAGPGTQHQRLRERLGHRGAVRPGHERPRDREA
jgi:hypothetical protein